MNASIKTAPAVFHGVSGERFISLWDQVHPVRIADRGNSRSLPKDDGVYNLLLVEECRQHEGCSGKMKLFLLFRQGSLSPCYQSGYIHSVRRFPLGPNLLQILTSSSICVIEDLSSSDADGSVVSCYR